MRFSFPRYLNSSCGMKESAGWFIEGLAKTGNFNNQSGVIRAGATP